eukprot:scaffold12333_cov63-Cylindrotheca_fusiformis.AAC.2
MHPTKNNQPPSRLAFKTRIDWSDDKVKLILLSHAVCGSALWLVVPIFCDDVCSPCRGVRALKSWPAVALESLRTKNQESKQQEASWHRSPALP